MKKTIKIVLTSIGICLPLAFVTAFAKNWKHETPISCVGSSGVKPFVELFAKNYSKTNKSVDITVDAGGSGFGISQIAHNFCNIGDASKNPFNNVRSDYKEKWIENEIRTITIGWEAICVIYIPPKNLNLSFDQLNSLLSVNDDNGGDLMRLFSGFNEGNIGSNFGSLGEFFNSGQFDTNVQNKLNNTTVVPYVRAGGALTSGTASSFYTESHLDQSNWNLNQKQKDALLYGDYGKDRKLYDTDEANSRAWEMFRKNNLPGSMIYLSSGFVIPNINLIRKAGYGIMEYKDSQAIIDNKIAENNDWLRPLNTIFPSKTTSQSKQFIQFMLSENEDVWSKLGGRKLTPEEIGSMQLSDPTSWNNVLSDSELEVDRTTDWDWNDNTVFGAWLNNSSPYA